MKLRSGRTIGVVKSSLVRLNLSVKEMLRIRDLYLRVGFECEYNLVSNQRGFDQICYQKEIDSEYDKLEEEGFNCN